MTNAPILIELAIFAGLFYVLWRSGKRMEKLVAEDKARKAAETPPAPESSAAEG